jgi:hypothetical protein
MTKIKPLKPLKCRQDQLVRNNVAAHREKERERERRERERERLNIR